MWSLTSLRTKRFSSFRKFRLLSLKDFFDSIDPEPTLDFASHNIKKRHSRPARGGMAEVVTTMHLFDLTHISRCRCPAQSRT
jgi:hypothetical protein